VNSRKLNRLHMRMGPFDIAIRLADEGVPRCAFARAVCIPSAELLEYLTRAPTDAFPGMGTE
jgi:hypothetical protein